MKIVISADRSAEGAAARDWCRDHASADDDVIAVIGFDQFSEVMLTMSPLVDLVDESRLRDDVAHDICEPLAERGMRCAVRLLNSAQSRAVLDVASAERADLIVVGKRPHRAALDAVLNETASHLVHRPPCPIVVVPTSSPLRQPSSGSAAPVDAVSGSGAD